MEPGQQRTLHKTKRTAIRLRRLANAVYRLGRLGKKSAANIRVVQSSQGQLRVLEYGFDDPAVLPLYIDLHGGGQVLMQAEADEWKNIQLREKTGVKIISIDYPKAPEKPYPAAVEAVQDVVCHYVNNAAFYGINAKAIGIGGYSAGGNLALVAALKANKTKDFQFQYLILVYPPLDLASDPYKKKTPKGAISPQMAAMFNACYVDPKRAIEPECSPIYATKEELAGLPHTLLLLAGRDSLYEEGAEFAQMLQEAGVAVSRYDFMEAAHGFTYKHSADTDKAIQLISDFIKIND